MAREIGTRFVEKRSNSQAIYQRHVCARDTKELRSISESQKGLLFIQ